MLLDAVKELEAKYKSRTRRLLGFQKLMSVRNEEKGVYNWFPFFQAFTSGFLEKIFHREYVRKSQHVMDPFAGSGNTLVACLEFGKNGYGLEVNPLFRLVAEAKTRHYKENHFKTAIKTVVKAAGKSYDVEFPNLSSFERLFDPKVLKRLIILRNEALAENDEEVTWLLILALVSELLNFSSAKRYGKGLHIVKNPYKGKVEKTIIAKLNQMRSEYKQHRSTIEKAGSVLVAPYSAFDIEKADSIPIVDLVLTSPPYCNSSDYVEMYKLELWFLEYVTEQCEFKDLSYRTIRSHLSFNNFCIKWSHSAVDEICWFLENVKLWNTRIPMMIRGYFDDLHAVLEKVKGKMEINGRIILTIGNSSYSGVVVPSDLLLAEVAEDLGFKVESIEVARQLPSSPQQRKIMDERSKQLMRESLVILSG